MTIDRLRQAHNARPFVPYTIHMADGRQIRIGHPDVLAMSQSGRTILVVHPDDSYSVLDLLRMTELHVDKSTAANA